MLKKKLGMWVYALRKIEETGEREVPINAESERGNSREITLPFEGKVEGGAKKRSLGRGKYSRIKLGGGKKTQTGKERTGQIAGPSEAKERRPLWRRLKV